MSRSEEIKVNITSHATHRGLEKSTTLNRRYVKRPKRLIISDGTEATEEANRPKVEYHKTRKASKIIDADIMSARAAAKISHMSVEIDPIVESDKYMNEDIDLPPAPNPYQAAIDRRKTRKKTGTAMSSKALKDAAIAKALADMEKSKSCSNTMSKAACEDRIAERVMRSEMEADKKAKKVSKKAPKSYFRKRKAGRILLAFATSAACVIALAAIVKINLPNISVTVAAAQTGVNAKYPSYIPRDFTIHDVYTDGSSVIIKFEGPKDTSFTLTEEKSSWDSNALLTNYVKSAYGDEYSTIRENGITVYINHCNAAWVNNGTFYKITSNVGVLSKKQIKNIVSSL